jgi:hypothetical protein
MPKPSAAPSPDAFKMLILEFVNDFNEGRYDTLANLKKVDDVANRFPELQSSKKKILKEILHSPVSLNRDSLNEYSFYSNDYSDGSVFPSHASKRKRESSSTAPSKRRRLTSVCVPAKNLNSIFYNC